MDMGRLSRSRGLWLGASGLVCNSTERYGVAISNGAIVGPCTFWLGLGLGVGWVKVPWLGSGWVGLGLVPL